MPLAAIPWDGQTNLDGGSYTVDGDVVMGADIEVKNAVITVSEGATLSMPALGELLLQNTQVTGKIFTGNAPTINLDNSHVDEIETAATAGLAEIYLYNYATVGKITVLAKNSTVQVNGSAEVDEIDAEASKITLQVNGQGTRVGKVTMVAGSLAVAQATAGAVVEEVYISPTGTSTTTKGTITNAGYIGTVYMSGYAQVSNYRESEYAEGSNAGVIDLVIVDGENAVLNNYEKGILREVVLENGTLNNGYPGTYGLGNGVIEELTIHNGSAGNQKGSTIGTATITGGVLTNGQDGDISTITELNVQGGQVTNESLGVITTINLSAGQVKNSGQVGTVNKAPGSTGDYQNEDSGSTGQIQENMVKLLLGAMANGTVEVALAEDGTPVAHNTSIPSGTELLVTAIPAEGYLLKNGSLLQNGVPIEDGRFTVGTADVTVTAVFISKDTLQIWDGSSNPQPGLYEVTSPLVISGTVEIPAGVEIRLGAGGSLTVAQGGQLDNSGFLKIPVLVTAGGTLNNKSGGTVADVTVNVGGTVENQQGGQLEFGLVNGGQLYNSGEAQQVQVDNGAFYHWGAQATAGFVQQNNGTVDCYAGGTIEELMMEDGDTWCTDNGVIEKTTIVDGRLICQKHYMTGVPGRLAEVVAQGGSLQIGEDGQVDRLTIAQGALPTVDNQGTILTVEGDTVASYAVLDGRLTYTDLTASSVTISWQPLQAKMLVGGTYQDADPGSITYAVKLWNEPMGSWQEAYTYPNASGQFLGETSFRVNLPATTTLQTYYFCVVAWLNSDESQRWGYEEQMIVFPAGPVQPLYIDPVESSVQQGTTLQLHAYGENHDDLTDGVWWTLLGQKDQGTYLNSSGLLRVGANETAQTLTIRAQSKSDNRALAEATVTVVQAPVSKYQLTVIGGEGSGSYPVGSKIVVLAKPAEGMCFDRWVAEGLELSQEEETLNPLTIYMPDGPATLTAHFAPVPAEPPEDPVQPELSQDEGGFADSYRGQELDFWMQVQQQISQAQPGDTIQVNAGNFDRVPYTVMRALAQLQNGTLRITWNGGGEIVIPSAAAPQEAMRIYYPLAYLAGMDFGPAAAEDAADPVNPATGGVWEVVAPVDQACDGVTPAGYGLATSAPAGTQELGPGPARQQPAAQGGPWEGWAPLAGAASVIAAGAWYWRRRVRQQ